MPWFGNCRMIRYFSRFHRWRGSLISARSDLQGNVHKDSDQKDKELRKERFQWLRLWSNHRSQCEVSWEFKDEMRTKYPQLCDWQLMFLSMYYEKIKFLCKKFFFFFIGFMCIVISFLLVITAIYVWHVWFQYVIIKVRGDLRIPIRSWDQKKTCNKTGLQALQQDY